MTWGKIADVLQQRGELEKALRIRRDVQLPAFEQIGDTRSTAVSWGQIADVLQQRGEVEEALRIRREVELPEYERIGDTRSATVTWGKIADVLQQRGELVSCAGDPSAEAGEGVEDLIGGLGPGERGGVL
ncbi:tetratricopeptide repeat protein, partial [Kitasatospora sp. NPDC050463]|uniref:tetratricopeptide repeat protein n=1 Tax=Kitasatospora sp. NPDC050463 TaxID=3155786 RepID=UPI003402010E